MIKITWDKLARAGYLQITTRKIKTTREFGNVHIDFDAAGNLVGIEWLEDR